MRTEKNWPLVGFVLLALLIGYGGLYLTDLPPVRFVVIVAVAGIAASMLVRKYLDIDE
jgi:uncharacterized membrane protein